jgi:hypothetical protein
MWSCWASPARIVARSSKILGYQRKRVRERERRERERIERGPALLFSHL